MEELTSARIVSEHMSRTLGLADANELRDWRIGADIAAVLVRRARKLYGSDDIGLDLANTVYRAVARDVDSASAQIKGPVLTGANSLNTKVGLETPPSRAGPLTRTCNSDRAGPCGR